MECDQIVVRARITGGSTTKQNLLSIFNRTRQLALVGRYGNTQQFADRDHCTASSVKTKGSIVSLPGPLKAGTRVQIRKQFFVTSAESETHLLYLGVGEP